MLKARFGIGINAHITKETIIYLFLKAYLLKTIIERRQSAGTKIKTSPSCKMT